MLDNKIVIGELALLMPKNDFIPKGEIAI